MKEREYCIIKEGLNRIRNINETLQTEKESKNIDNKSECVPYTQKDDIMSNILSTTKAQFGADYSKFKTPMLYYPSDGDVTLSGEISSLNNAKFQFRYKDSSGNGCYVWIEPLQLTDENLQKLQVIYGVFKNWKNDLASSEDIKPMSLKNDMIDNF